MDDFQQREMAQIKKRNGKIAVINFKSNLKRETLTFNAAFSILTLQIIIVFDLIFRAFSFLLSPLPIYHHLCQEEVNNSCPTFHIREDYER